MDSENLDKISSDFINEATAHEEKGNLVLVYNEYNRMVRNLSGYTNLDSIARKVRSIENNKSYIRQLKIIKHNIRLEQQLQKFYYKKLEKNFLNQKNFDWWSKEINTIKLSLDDPTSEKAKMSKRLLANVGGYAYDLANTVESKYATFYYDICILINPNYPQAYFKQIANYSKNNDKLWIYGGIHDSGQSTRIFSSDDGIIWMEETETTPFIQYQSLKFTVLGDKIFRIAGYTSEIDDLSLERNVYSSINGLSWDLETENHGFETKYSFQVQSLNGILYSIEPYPDPDIDGIGTRTSMDGTN
ncbi:hypothetical protein FVB32_16010 [Flagellimonas hymeniacidonis]|uniref:Uncharacterized protein n=1 Tax=Flagellimonas hymeniacidonis TaxID=2603628 RepID=A0A5C8V2S7_9FLAO|nr:hypothetical protein [Flagellimonas hymeniacidonis]TXN36063.1 hypothetical protein FVB32_16010 [Flagellimonas hymeniacidonis]